MVSGDQSGLRASAEGGGALRRDGVRRGSRAWKKIEGEEGGGFRRPLKRWAASGSASGEGKKIGARAAARVVREGGMSSGKTRGWWARVAAGERRRAHRGAGQRWGKRGRERGGWRVGRPMGWTPSISETRRAGERLAGGPSHNLIKFEIVQTI
jgi:hypothetical protein